MILLTAYIGQPYTSAAMQTVLRSADPRQGLICLRGFLRLVFMKWSTGVAVDACGEITLGHIANLSAVGSAPGAV